MKLETAKKVLIKECDFLGIKLEVLLADIQKYGRMLFSEKVCEAFSTYNYEGFK